MTLKENIMKLQTYKMFEGEDTLYVERDDVLKLLDQEQSGDPVSRKAVCEIINDIRDCISVEGYCAILERMKKLPSVNPQETKTGHCKDCKYYEYDSEMTKVYWQLTQDEKEDAPKIGRCTFGNKTCGNAVLSDGNRSDGAQGCNAFSHRGCRDELPFKKYDTFIHKRDGKESCVCWVDQIQYEYAPRMYRIKTEGGGGWSEDAETLSNPDKYVKLWEERGENE